MMRKNYLKILLLICSILSIGILIFSPLIHAQNWIEMPPYNTLWPLWSPVLSPINDITGLPAPVVSSLAPDTILPVMPALTWDPSLPYPWLLYNTLQGMTYFDPLAGINLWPAPSLLDSAGAPSPLVLPVDYANLPPTDAIWLSNNVFTANNNFLLSYPSFLPAFAGPAWFNLPPTLSDLLTPLDILGPVLGVPSALNPASLTTPIIAEQAGIWDGTWISLTNITLTGPMTLDLVDNPETGLFGTAHLVGDKLIPDPVEVAGPIPIGNFFKLEGTYVNPTSGSIFDIELRCTLESDVYITGTYFIQKVGFAMSEFGEFTLNLIAPPITIPAPSVAPLPPVATPVVPIITTTIPVPTAPVTAPVPIITPPLTSTIPVAPVITTVIVPPTAGVSGLFLPPPQLQLPYYPLPFLYPNRF